MMKQYRFQNENQLRMFSLSFDFNLQKSSSEFKLTLAKFSIPALSGKFCRVTKTQDLTMMTQQHERHFKPRISKEVSLTLRLLEKREFPHEFVEMSWSKSSKHIIKSTQYKSGYVLGRQVHRNICREGLCSSSNISFYQASQENKKEPACTKGSVS